MITKFNEIIKMKYTNALYIFIRDFIDQNETSYNDELKYEVRRGGAKKFVIDFGFSVDHPKRKLMIFFTSFIEGDNRIINSPQYIGLTYWEITKKLDEYLNSLMIYDPDTAYYIVKDWDELISNLTMENYNLWKDAKKYNL